MPKAKKTKGKRSAIRRRTYQVFISHATADKWVATQICEILKTRDVQTFRDDRDINGGEEIPEAIRKAIRQSDEMIVLLTPSSVNRPWVQFEMGAAWGRRDGYRINILLYHTTANDIPQQFNTKKACSLNDFGQVCAEIERRARGRST